MTISKVNIPDLILLDENGNEIAQNQNALLDDAGDEVIVTNSNESSL